MEEIGPENEFYRNLSALIEATERTILNSTHNYLPLIDDAVNYVEAAMYSNLIRLYSHNLNEGFFKRVRMGKEDRTEFMKVVSPFFLRARQTSESSYNQGEVDFSVYQDFRKAVHDFGDDTYWLLLGVERYADIIACEHRLITFKNSMQELIRKRAEADGPRPRRTRGSIRTSERPQA